MPVNRVAQDGAAEAVFHVDADLVGATGEQSAADKRTVLLDGEAFPLGDGFFSSSIIEDGHAFAIHGMAADEVLLATTRFRRNAVDDGEVGFADATVRKRFGEAAMGAVVFGDDDAAGGVFV